MSGKLIMLYKDGEIPTDEFCHLGDIVIHNQWVERPGGHPANGLSNPKYIEFVANKEEMQRLSWFAQFSSQDILYVLDKPQQIRERLSNKDIKQAVNVVADVFLVQFGSRLHCLKNEGGTKVDINFVCIHREDSVKTPDELIKASGYPEEAMKSAIRFRNDILIQKGASCELCGFCSNIDALDFYKQVPTDRLRRIPMILWGEIITEEKLEKELDNHSHIFCSNCAITIAYEQEEVQDSS